MGKNNFPALFISTITWGYITDHTYKWVAIGESEGLKMGKYM